MRTTGLHQHKPLLVFVATALLLVAANVNAQSPPNATVARSGGNTTPPFVVRTWNVTELPCLGVNASIVNVTFAGGDWAQALMAGSGGIADLCVDITQDIATAVFGWDANCTGGALKVVALRAANTTSTSNTSGGGLRVSIHVSRLVDVNESLWRANEARLPLLEAWYERMKPVRQSRNRTDHPSPPFPTSKNDRGGGHRKEDDDDDDDDDDDEKGTEHHHQRPPQVFVLAMSVVDSNGHAGVYFRSGSFQPTTTAAPETSTTVVVVVSSAADSSLLILIVAASLVVVVLGVLVGVVCWVVRRNPDGAKGAVLDEEARVEQPPPPSAEGQHAAASSHQVQVTLNVEAVMLARAAQRETPPIKRPRPAPAVIPPPPVEEEDFTQLASAAPAPRTATTPSRRRVVVIDVPTNVLVAPPAALQPAAAEAGE